MLYEIWIVFTIIGILELALMVAQGVTDGLSALSSAADLDDQILEVLLLPAMASLIYLLTWALKVARPAGTIVHAYGLGILGRPPHFRPMILSPRSTTRN